MGRTLKEGSNASIDQEIEFRRRWFEAHAQRFEADTVAASGAEARQHGFRESAGEALRLREELTRTGDVDTFGAGTQAWAGKPGTLAFNNPIGQMLINQLVKRSDDPAALALVLSDSLAPPIDDSTAQRRIQALVDYIENIRVGAHPAPGTRAVSAVLLLGARRPCSMASDLAERRDVRRVLGRRTASRASGGAIPAIHRRRASARGRLRTIRAGGQLVGDHEGRLPRPGAGRSLRVRECGGSRPAGPGGERVGAGQRCTPHRDRARRRPLGRPRSDARRQEAPEGWDGRSAALPTCGSTGGPARRGVSASACGSTRMGSRSVCVQGGSATGGSTKPRKSSAPRTCRVSDC